MELETLNLVIEQVLIRGWQTTREWAWSGYLTHLIVKRQLYLLRRIGCRDTAEHRIDIQRYDGG